MVVLCCFFSSKNQRSETRKRLCNFQELVLGRGKRKKKGYISQNMSQKPGVYTKYQDLDLYELQQPPSRRNKKGTMSKKVHRDFWASPELIMGAHSDWFLGSSLERGK